MTKTAIQIDGLQVVRGTRTLLNVPALAVEASEVLTVLGPNGAGKSTLLKCCVGFLRASGGRVQVLGQPLDRWRPIALTRLRRRIAYLAQLLAPGSEMPLTVREVVAIGRTGIAGLFRSLRSEDWRIIGHWLERLGLDRLAHEPYSVLSGGEQRKTLLAMAMAQQPEILLLDEPAANLDLFWREQIVATLDAIHRETQITIILVCHELEMIPPCCHRLLLLDRGNVAACGPAAAVLTPQRIAALYGPQLKVRRDGGRHFLVPRGTGELT